GSIKTGTYGVSPEELSKFIAGRVAVIRAGDPAPMDIPHSDGRIIRSWCATLPSGGRMLTYTDVTDLVRRANQFEHLATIDGLTGLCNRRQFDLLAEAEWKRFQRYYRPLSLLLLDVDCFKQINDRLGHDAGDRVLKEVARLCAEGRRSSDIVARLGGDEFVLLLPETELPDANAVAERVRRSVEQFVLPHDTGNGFPITVSVGVAMAAAGMSGTGALMRAADKALYEAKSAGRNCTRTVQEASTANYRAAAE